MYRICVIPGDGIGQEVIPAAMDVLRACPLELEFVQAEAGFAVFEKRGVSVPEETLASIRACDATLFGATTSPLGRVAGFRSAAVTMRQSLDLYANVRPVFSIPHAISRPGLDMVIVRENTEGLYSGLEERLPDRAIAKRVISVKGSQRIIRYAFELARRQHRRRVTIVHKANILKETDGIFRDVGFEIAKEYPEIEAEEMLVDATAMRLVLNPERFSVIVTTNLFGDILSDEASALMGGLGLAPSGNIGDKAAIFEPVHGSAPDIVGKGIANPLATILAAGMLLDHIGESEQAERLRSAVLAVIAEGVRTPDLGGTATTGDVTRAVIAAMRGEWVEHENLSASSDENG